MASSKIRLDHAGMAAMLRSPAVMREVSKAADKVRARVASDPAIQRHGMPVLKTTGYTDRARAIVTVAHPGALGVQAKHGSLTRALGGGR